MSDRKKIIHRLRVEIHALEQEFPEENPLIQILRKQLQDHETCAVDERREQVFRRAAWDLSGHAAAIDLGRSEFGHRDDVGEAIIALGAHLDHKYVELRAIQEIGECIHAGQLLGEVMDNAFHILEKLVPYDRIGVSLIDKDALGNEWVRLDWVRAKYPTLHLKQGHSAELDHSRLKGSFSTHEPVCINDLQSHLAQHPNSTTAALLAKEGINATLAYPLIARGDVIGFIFFASCKPHAYDDDHIDLFSQFATQLALVIEKCRAYELLTRRNEFIKQMFGRYVTEEVADMILEGAAAPVLSGERRKVTVLFSDLRDFTPMATSLPPERVVEALNTYFEAMTEIVMRYEGRVDNFIGDAILAVFGAPVSKPDDAARAAACAIEMENRMLSINAELKNRNLPELTMGIGLNTGEVIAGNIGSDLRMTYSVIGDPVNIASRVSAFASKGQILATQATFEDVQEIAETGGNLRVTVKGIPDPVRVHELIGIKGSFNVRKWSEQ